MPAGVMHTDNSQNQDTKSTESSGLIMKSLYKAASTGSFVMLAGMLVHNINASYLEPTFLGFVDKAKDYGDMAKIQNAFESCGFDALQMCSFIYSGYAHIVNGLMFMLLGVATREAFRSSSPILSKLCFVAGLLTGIGFFAIGVTDIPGTKYATLLRELNPEFNTEILLAMTLIRGVVMSIAAIGLGFFALFVGRAALHSDQFSNWGAWWGFTLLLPGLGGLINPVFGFFYLVLILPWVIWLGLQFKALAARS